MEAQQITYYKDKFNLKVTTLHSNTKFSMLNMYACPLVIYGKGCGQPKGGLYRLSRGFRSMLMSFPLLKCANQI
jgi:hypothetical protein